MKEGLSGRHAVAWSVLTLGCRSAAAQPTEMRALLQPTEMRALLQQGHASHPRGGFTLIEVMIASVMLALVSGGLYACGIQAYKMSRLNLLSTQARGLGVQKIEELVGGGFETIALQAPYEVQTNFIQDAYQVVRSVEISGHNADGSPVSNLAHSAYLEVHVHIEYNEPRSGRLLTDTYSTIVH